MNPIKVDVLWSPIDDDLFVTIGNVIRLHQVKACEKEDAAKISCSTKIVDLATISDIQLVKTVAWYPKSDLRNVLAVGQTNGKIIITGFGENQNDDLIGKELYVRNARQCNYLAWNPNESNLLAQGLENRVRNEPSVLVWDVLETPDRSRLSFSEGIVNKPAVELGSGETSSSFCWFPTDPKVFCVGMANKHLRIYDLRDVNKSRRETHHRFVYGVCVDPLNAVQLASYSEAQVALWDLRSFDRPISTITESKNVVKISWCPTKLGMLSVLCKDSSCLRLHDIRHALIGLDEIEQASIERNINPFGKPLSSYCWHPTHENRLMAVQADGTLRDMTVFERIPLEFSPSFKLIMPFGKESINFVESSPDDISSIMKKRVLQDYGLHADNIQANVIACDGEQHLLGLWRWIYNIRSINSSRTAKNIKQKIPQHVGILPVLHFDKETDQPPSSDPVFVQWKAQDNLKYKRKTHFRSNQRHLALQMCGWCPDTGGDDFILFIDNLVQRGYPERAAAISLFYLRIKKALDILSGSGATPDNGNAGLQSVAMALSGYTEEKNALWRRTCGTLRFQLENPYLRAIFAFLSCEEDDFQSVLNEAAMSVEDRVAFALNYLSDAKLKTYLLNLSEELTQSGDLDGLLLTGMANSGINLLENYVDKTCDVQTAAVAVVYSASSLAMKDARVLTWIDTYRELLDRWRLWHHRARFDILRQTQDSRVQPDIVVSCNFCGKAIIPSKGLLNRAKNLIHPPPTRAAQNKPKINCCPHCRKALPRCAICLKNMGTSSMMGFETRSKTKVTPFEEWFTWCQTCRHGGHASHLTQWFTEHKECPVTGCVCKCVGLDVVSQRLSHPAADEK